MLECIGEIAYRLDLLLYAVLCSAYNMFHVPLLRARHNSGVHADVPPIKINGKAEYKVSGVEDHRKCEGKM